jgi:hypothetical protein
LRRHDPAPGLFALHRDVIIDRLSNPVNARITINRFINI